MLPIIINYPRTITTHGPLTIAFCKLNIGVIGFIETRSLTLTLTLTLTLIKFFNNLAHLLGVIVELVLVRLGHV